MSLCRFGSPAAACSSPADFDVACSMGMVSQLAQSKFTGSCACLRPAPQAQPKKSVATTWGQREGLPMSREPALLTSAGRMPERSQHRVSAGQDGRSERPAMGHGQPRPKAGNYGLFFCFSRSERPATGHGQPRPRARPTQPRPRWRKYLRPGTKKQMPLTTPKRMCANGPDTHITSAVAKSTAAWI